MKKLRIILMVCVLCTVGLMTGCGKKDSMDVDLSAFETPDGFEWEGIYIDDREGQAVLSIEQDGKQYTCMISVPNSDVSHIDTYQFSAGASDDGMGLAYTDGSMTSMDLPDFAKNPDGEIMTSEVYSDGTGAIYYLDGYLQWLDDVNNAGGLYAFRKLDESETASISIEATETTEDTGSAEEENTVSDEANEDSAASETGEDTE